MTKKFLRRCLINYKKIWSKPLVVYYNFTPQKNYSSHGPEIARPDKMHADCRVFPLSGCVPFDPSIGETGPACEWAESREGHCAHRRSRLNLLQEPLVELSNLGVCITDHAGPDREEEDVLLTKTWIGAF